MSECEQCRAKDKRIAQLERDLDEARQAVDTLTRNYLAAVERGKKK